MDIDNKLKVVVTGGAGFIGSHLSEELSKGDYHVTIVDDLSTGKIQNIESLIAHKNVEFVEGSVTDLSLMQELLLDACYVFHLAALPGISLSIEDPQTVHEVNVTGTLNVLLAARDNGLKKVIYSSSAAVYGNNPVQPKHEAMLPDPRSPYAVTKLTSEYYCIVFHQVYGLPTACLRYFNVYGPRQDPSSQYTAVIPQFIKDATDGYPLTIDGDGVQTRDFIFVKDVVSVNMLVAEREVNGILNVGTGESNSINYLASLITKIMGKNVTTVHNAPRPGDIKYSSADISRSRALGYKPKYSLEEGLRQTMERFR